MGNSVSLRQRGKFGEIPEKSMFALQHVTDVSALYRIAESGKRRISSHSGILEKTVKDDLLVLPARLAVRKTEHFSEFRDHAPADKRVIGDMRDPRRCLESK